MILNGIRTGAGGAFVRRFSARASSRNPLVVALFCLGLLALMGLALILVLGALLAAPFVALGVLGARKLGLLGRTSKRPQVAAGGDGGGLKARPNSAAGETIDVVAEVRPAELP